MIITVNRQFQTKYTTISTIFIDEEFQCFGLENPYNSVKIPGNTRIPPGEYPVRLRTDGGKHHHYTKRYLSLHQGMLQIQNVPGFEHILIHVGNYNSNTDGCLLLGRSVIREKSGDYMVGESSLAYVSFYKSVVNAAKNDCLLILINDE